MDDHIISIFNFAKKFLANDRVLLLFHQYDLYVLKEIKSYLESCNF